MNSKERVLTILNHKEADRIPMTNRFTPEIADQLADILGMDYTDSFDLEVELGHDLLGTKEIGIVSAYSMEANRPAGDDLYICDFGILKKKMHYPKDTR